jgi:hypothetical protein
VLDEVLVDVLDSFGATAREALVMSRETFP